MSDKVSTILDGLNEEQRKAVSCTEGPVLIVAGAGSGKTRVLTSRIAYILSGGTDPSRVLALTFTKKAAGEMKERIAGIVGSKPARKLVMGTFHAVFVRFLREYAGFLGYPDNLPYTTHLIRRALSRPASRNWGWMTRYTSPRRCFPAFHQPRTTLSRYPPTGTTVT